MAEKDLSVTNTADAQAKISDVKVVGNPDIWTLLCKASSKEQGWMKSTKGMEVPGGVLVQSSTQQGSNVAEAMAFVPGVKIGTDAKGNKVLVAL